jgi:hypothetical protein
MTREERQVVFSVARRLAGKRKLVDVFDDSLSGDRERGRARRIVRQELGCSLEHADNLTMEFLEP